MDAAIERRLPARQLRRRIQRLSRRVHEALEPRHRHVWLSLEAELNELAIQREAAYFDLGFEHGFATGRGTGRRMSSGAQGLAAKLCDLAIQHGSREDALAAVLEAAYALAVEPARPAAARKKKAAAYASTASGASVVRDGDLAMFGGAAQRHEDRAQPSSPSSSDAAESTERRPVGSAGAFTYRYSDGGTFTWGGRLEAAVDRAG